MIDLTQDKVKDLFEYRDGALFWKNRTVDSLGRNIKYLNGRFAGSIDSSGYLQIKIDGKLHFNHRIIFLMFNGYVPKVLDHVDGDKTNNKIENLRSASIAQNNHNVKIRQDNTSGYKNVCWHKGAKKWQVALHINKQRKCFGNYDDIELADLVATEARNKFHKEFANHGTH